MKILLTGYKGFIGSHMLNALSEHEVTTFEWGETLPEVEGHDWVIHMGANSSTTERNIEKIMHQNVDFSVWLLNQCIKYNVNMQYSSSASVYGMRTENFTEDAPVDPKNPYAWTKYLFERHVSNLGSNKKDHIRIQGFRYFNVYGTGEDHKLGQASPHHTFTKQALETGVIKLFENSENYRRDFVPVEMVVDYHIKFFEVQESGIWNIGTEEPTSFEHVARTIAKKHNAKIEYIPMPEKLKASYQTYTCADMTKTLNSLKFKGN